jgi:tRNA threonylcarbamoyladenosine biosynthesis protein TsaE
VHRDSILTTSVDQTLSLGVLIGRLAAPPPANTCIVLDGNLGAGKTHLTRGIALGALVDDPSLVCSPTYVLLNIYQGPKPVYHLDAYRVATEDDFEVVGFDELLKAGGLIVVEWAARIPQLLPAQRLGIAIHPQEHEEHRLFEFTATGAACEKLTRDVLAAWQQNP